MQSFSAHGAQPNLISESSFFIFIICNFTQKVNKNQKNKNVAPSVKGKGQKYVIYKKRKEKLVQRYKVWFEKTYASKKTFEQKTKNKQSLKSPDSK